MAEPAITRFLRSTRPSFFNAYCVAAAFGAYFCTYALRKPFTVGLYEGSIALPLLPALPLKIAYVIAQVVGYMISKFVGIKIVSEAGAKKRGRILVALVLWAEAALLLFALVPAPYRALCLLANGLPLGMIWGLVFAHLEGRRSSELLGAGLSASYIVASGAVKSAGRFVLAEGVSEEWMPVVTGLLFLAPLAICIYLLRQIPPPTEEDERMRVKREPMDGAARWHFFVTFAPGLIALTALYMLLTAYRDFRDNFARELWDALEFTESPEVFAISEVPIAALVLVALALVMRVRDNRRAVDVIHLLMLGGTLSIGISTGLFALDIIGGGAWMVCVGLGLYLAYVPYGCILFDRLVAMIGVAATAGFLIYLSDAFGYLGSVVLLLYKSFAEPTVAWLPFFVGFSYVTSIACSAAFAFSFVYFRRRAAIS